jgi:hypothetical protein
MEQGYRSHFIAAEEEASISARAAPAQFALSLMIADGIERES